MSYKKIIAVDFDGVLNLDSTYPRLGEPNTELIKKLNEWQGFGNKIILWTSRDGKYLKDAVDFCKENGLYPDAVNDNIPETVDYFGGNSRKVYADYYIDDKAITQSEIEKSYTVPDLPTFSS